ncbi:hypothetical protein RIB2604_01706440 [Aspergillus luchuensis]|uniref:ZZ-type domain-containing protein n=1 Tax=Aspergillus kawachii TaxID=1069201 RepID=A0A146FC82_ASPKA|nr:hypothetical protein RIB2604_01706440 [Aspergillus luchuensis]
MDFLQQAPPSVQDLLRAGEPFIPFSEYSVQDITHLSEDETTKWVETKLRDGKPFVIRGFSRLKEWDWSVLNNERLGSLSSSAAIPVRNCHTGRDAKMRLQDLLSQTEYARTGNVREFLYAKDLQCPQEWIKALDAFLPSAMRHLGSLDLFRTLPKEIAPEVLMAYVGTRKSSSSLVSFFDYIQPFYQRYCHADTGRVPLIPLHALIRGSLGTEDEALLLDVFLKLLDDEAIETDSVPPMKTVDTQGAVVECNFCGLTIWNRHLHCEQCGDFDLCLTCFISGRSCKHVADYTWAELIPRAYCMEVIQSTRNRLRGRLLSRIKHPKYDLSLQAYGPYLPQNLCLSPVSRVLCDQECASNSTFSRQKSLGALAAAAADARKQPMMVRNNPNKPVRSRIKSIDPRGRIMGFTDNVFDQKRGKRASMATHSASLPPEVPSRVHKRPRTQVSDEEAELPRQQEDYSTFTNRGMIQSQSTEDTIHSSARPYVMSSRSIGPKGQLRISDLVEEHSPAEAEPSFQAPFRHASPLLSLTPGDGAFRRPANEPSVPATTDEASISFLERKLEELRRYADELLDLSLVDSHAKVQEKISQLQGQIEERKRRKAEALFDSLDRDFPELATVAREEARRRGL